MKKIILIALTLIFLLAACSNKPTEANPAATANTDSGTAAGTVKHEGVLAAQTISALDARFVSGINSFGLSAAGLLCEDADVNVAFSPVSITLALAMTRTGASGDTAAQMANALGLDSMSDDEIANACASLMWRANTGGMEAANAIWLGDTYTFSDAFLNACTGKFMADALPLVIPGATADINAWASEKTHGRITEVLTQELPPETEIVLTNALYYLGDWVMPFEANDTFDEEFAAPDGGVTAPFMHSTRNIPYYENDDFSMISLDFASEDDQGQYAMALLLPKEGTDLTAMLAVANGDAFDNALGALDPRQVHISLPKFEYDFFTSLKQTLKALGMTDAFDANADFSPMTVEPNGLFIADVLHKCYIRVDELGAEAAAVTEVVMLESAMESPEDLALFRADRPFLFAIYSREDGAIAFMGTVNDPTQK